MSVLKMQSTTARQCTSIQDYLERDGRATTKSYSDNLLDRDNWGQEMDELRAITEQRTGRTYYHIVQSYDDEPNKKNYNAQDINRLGNQLAKTITNGGDYQYAVITHTDTDNLHNHIIISSTDLQTGKKLQIKNDQIRAIQSANSELDKQHNLHTLTQSKQLKNERERRQGKQPTQCKTDEIYLINRNESYKQKMRDKLQKIFADTTITNNEDYKQALKNMGLEISRETSTGNITYRDKDGNKARAKGLGAFNRSDINTMQQKNQQQLQQQLSLGKQHGLSRGGRGR